MFRDKIVLVTGSSRGIGKAVAISFAQNGASVIINCRSSSQKAKGTLNEIKKLGATAEFIDADISQETQVNELKKNIQKGFGGLDVLVNNAGILRKEFPSRPNWKYWDEVLSVNLKGLAMCSYILSDIMNDNSSIINLASVWGLELPAYDANAYAASKAGVVNLTKTLALQLAPKTRVNAVAPSIVATEMLHENNTKTRKWLNDNIPLQRAAEPEEIAELVLFLASEKARFITGEVVKIDGGLTLKI
jgi:3-oxoacyl-[acyl-carrier protein] reductase